MNFKTYKFSEHLAELKVRVLKVLICFLLACGISYCYSKNIYNFLTIPLKNILPDQSHRMIYTGLAEGFFTYLQLSFYTGFLIIIPILSAQIYFFIAPGLYKSEKYYFRILIFISPILFYLGNLFAFFLVIPNACYFFLGFESLKDTGLPIVLEARMSEYLTLLIQFSLAFGISFELPLILIMLNLLNIISISTLIKKRRIAIVLNFIIAAVLTPPDIISQFALATPLILLYEASIITCKILKSRTNARHKVD
ncbi:twin arginine-targeting protein translocase TatC [Orientia chuto str. Dubai]|uniref:Sec-independent protein translocase protein TatC n=1 Tax=Orientia chuto str. Dubai TaxID=1359168 RepID=A0A0F3MMT4_9RICK|nr:twin-arginine translocase subunit TatC [Candidatus Orientia mediorientalis]KJV57063.1 twin arginine-targeting protein translocase TatC [Orientia chuto str. Dubai]